MPSRTIPPPAMSCFMPCDLERRVVGTVTFQQVDDTPCAEAAADSHNQNLQSVNSRSEKFHIHFLHLIKD